MGKRSNFARKALDTYDTPNAAVAPLLPHLPPKTRFIDPCAGAGDLVEHLIDAGHVFNAGYDLQPRADYIRQAIFWPPTVAPSRPKTSTLHHQSCRGSGSAFASDDRPLRSFDRPPGLLIDANWMFTAQAEPFLRYCSKIVTVGRVRWIPGSTMTGKDDCAWFLFEPEPVMFTQFIGKTRQHDG